MCPTHGSKLLRKLMILSPEAAKDLLLSGLGWKVDDTEFTLSSWTDAFAPTAYHRFLRFPRVEPRSLPLLACRP